MHLVTQFYEPPWNHRAEEIRTCLVRNFENPHIFRIHLFDESAGLAPQELIDSQLRTELAEKLIHLPCTGRRLTFQQAVDYANQALGSEICVLANADVYFDDSLSELARFFGEETRSSVSSRTRDRVSLALLRHDVGEDGLPELRELNNFSQDAWCFVPPAGVRDADFNLGANACDNRFAWELRRAGLRPLFNRNYGETLACRKIVGGKMRRTSREGQRYRLHQHIPPETSAYHEFLASLPAHSLSVAYDDRVRRRTKRSGIGSLFRPPQHRGRT